MNVRKRSGKVVPFNAEFISRAISLASAAAGEHDEEEIASNHSGSNRKAAGPQGEIWDIETIQDTVEETLFEKKHYQTAKAYIRYRLEKEKERASADWKEGIFKPGIFKSLQALPQSDGSAGSLCIYPYLFRFLPRLGRREFWWETVCRAVEYNCSLAPTSREEAEKLYDNIYHMRQFLSAVPCGWAGLR